MGTALLPSAVAEIADGLEGGIQFIYLGSLLGILGFAGFIIVRQVLIRRELDASAKAMGERIRAGDATAEEYFEMGSIMLRKKVYTQAVRNLKLAAEMWEGDQEDLAQIHNALGFGYLETDKLDASVAEFKKAVELQPGYVTAWNNLGDALGAMGLHRECLPVREDELAVGRVHFPNHTPQIEANLARCHTQLGNYAEALRLRRSVVAALQKREGPLSRMSLEAARCLANALGDAGEAEEQRAVLRQLWPRLRRALGDAHATTLSCGAKLAHALVERGHACSDSVIAEAEDILWECLEAARDGGADDVTAVALEKSLEETRRLYLAEEADDDGDKFT